MDKSQVTQTLKKAKENSQKRNFTQSIDLIINLRDIDLKKPEQSVNFFHTFHYAKGKKVKICAFVGPELMPQAKKTCDMAISVDDFAKYEDKKQAKKLATEYDFFIAQAQRERCRTRRQAVLYRLMPILLHYMKGCRRQ